MTESMKPLDPSGPQFVMTDQGLVYDGDPELVRHSNRFRKVSNRYAHEVAAAYGYDLAAAAAATDEEVAAKVAAAERRARRGSEGLVRHRRRGARRVVSRHHMRRAHDHRKWTLVPVAIDPRCDDGEPVRCLARFPDDFVAAVARGAGGPEPSALYMANANPGPRNEVGDEHRPWMCLDCTAKKYDLAGALPGAERGFVMVRTDEEWRACTWDDFGAADEKYREPF